ncbi:dolichol-phosphate mannosyltransferase subunit 3 [Thelephora ganbajun]|uniref:Dolichol-phosphate mannosyltransferase subunit 3 n=1 Tax=Thelephora ganbajun TaxID=370292 RepID=A0ACB6ZPN3_THEGA|nr:dolichol-phosphate mannosyltransferase subunit 3 [Thelephora ganbajun]
MTRGTRFASYASAVVLCYFLAWFSIIPIPFIAEETKDQIIPVLPWWVLVSFGSYSLASLGWGLWSFRDCPDAYHELMHEIQEAKNDLRARGVTVD